MLQIRIKETIREHIDLFGEGVDEEPKGLLFFNKTSATVYVLRPVDYEQKNKLMVKLTNTSHLCFTNLIYLTYLAEMIGTPGRLSDGVSCLC